MNNMIDITDMTDAALDVYMRVKGGEDNVCVEHLTPEERLQVVVAMGLNTKSRLVQDWING